MSFIKSKRLIKWCSVILTALIAVVLLLLSWLYTTESGLQWLVARTMQFHPQGLHIGKVSGTLNSSIKLSTLDWQDERMAIQAENLSVDCQWLYLLDRFVSCEKLALNTVDVSSINEEKNTNTELELPALTTVKLPVKVLVKQVSIAAISYKTLNAHQPKHTSDAFTANAVEENSAQYISGLSIKKLALEQSKVSVSDLKLTTNEHKVSLSGFVNMRRKWQHQLAVNIQGPKLSASAKSTGRISELAKLTLQTTRPNPASMTSDWYYEQGLFLKHGKFLTEKQQVELGKERVAIDHLKANFALNWPKLSADLQAKAGWQSFDAVQLDINTVVPNLLDWRSSAAVSLRLHSELNEKQIAGSLQQMFPDTNAHNGKISKQAWPVRANLDMSIKQGVFTLKTNEITVGELTGELAGEFNLDSPSTEDLWLKGQLNGRSLILQDLFQVANIKANWQIEKQQANWHIASQGAIEKLAFAEFDGSNIVWAIDLSERWQADVKAESLKVEDNVVAQPLLHFSGLPEAHKMLFSANIAQGTSVKLNFDGKFLQAQAKPITIDSDLAAAKWQINKLEFEALNKQQNLLLAAEQLLLSAEQQQVKNLCLSGSGSFCINASNNQQQWSANLIFQQWAMGPVFEQVKAWQSILLAQSVQYPQELNGQLTGNLNVEGRGTQLEKIAINLALPSFKWRSSGVQVSGDALTINSQQQKNAVAITTQWQSITTDIKLPEWQSEILVPKGEALLSITPDFKIDFDLVQTDITLSIPSKQSEADSPIAKRLLTIARVELNGIWQQDKIDTRLNIRLPGEDEITVKLKSTWPLVDSAKVSGDLSLNLKEFDWLSQWQKGIDKIDINVVQNFTLSGTLQKPIIKGEGAIAIKHFVIDEYGLDIRDSQVKLSSQQDSIILLGELQNPQGALTIAGEANLSVPIKANLTIEGQQVTLVNNNENKLIVSPKLKASFQDKHLTVEGNLVVDQADIKVASLPKPAISVSEDQVIIDEKNLPPKDSAFDYHIALTLSAGENVKISGFGLSSEIQGNLSSTLISGQPLTLNGRLDLKDGKFEAYKQTLTIEQGQLLFLGTAANPSIQFRAIRIVDDIKVGIIADGTVQNPRLTLFSEPTMADENVLSLLITGRNLASLSQQEGNALTSAAISLGVESANKLVQKIGDQLGLKDVAFTSKSGNGGNSTRVDIAAKINDRLNVGYGTSIDSESGVQAGWSIEYKLSPSISFEAISGDEISANINYKKQYSPAKDKSKDQSKAND